ncbi:hypothetical protein EUGRSUZ_F02540 [Eucalyptus grandis]|uniref:Uncharacterized protein n=2 Tax=Eucalyptus grandis TaxID=71139 RepID=A0ACC3KIZ4_EUCGR|nr:hypothetical protein EUGRSUZ_F02540 [Eucalyptus grandis]
MAIKADVTNSIPAENFEVLSFCRTLICQWFLEDYLTNSTQALTPWNRKDCSPLKLIPLPQMMMVHTSKWLYILRTPAIPKLCDCDPRMIPPSIMHGSW